MRDKEKDRELEELLREHFRSKEHFRTAPDMDESSPRVVEAVLRQIRLLPQKAPVSPLNTLAWVLAAVTVLGWLAGRLWLDKAGVLAVLLHGSLDPLWNRLAFWMLSGAFQTIKALFLSGFGELFPLVLAGIMTAMILAARLPRRATR